MELYGLWRLLKWVGLSMWATGVFLTASQSGQSKRLHSVYSLSTAGFALTWMAGWMMMKHLGLSMGASWISNAMLFGLVSIVGSFLRAFSTEKGSVYNGMSFVGLALSLAWMVVRDGQGLPLVAGVAVLLAGWATWMVNGSSSADDEGQVQTQQELGFRWVARIEGLTVLVLFLLYIPAKKILAVNLDGGTGLIGWTHGVFVILYVLSLTLTFRALGWSWKQYVVGGVASFFPFGTIIFERKVLDSTDRE